MAVQGLGLGAEARDLDALQYHPNGGAWPTTMQGYCIPETARAYGADAVLLIVRCLAAERVPALIAAAAARDLVPLVEVATHDEARLALDAGAKLVGVNVRDLDSLDMNPERARRVLASLPSWAAAVHLSGLGDPDAVAKVADSRASAALIGEALMRQADPLPLLAAMRDRAG